MKIFKDNFYINMINSNLKKYHRNIRGILHVGLENTEYLPIYEQYIDREKIVVSFDYSTENDFNFLYTSSKEIPKDILEKVDYLILPGLEGEGMPILAWEGFNFNNIGENFYVKRPYGTLSKFNIRCDIGNWLIQYFVKVGSFLSQYQDFEYNNWGTCQNKDNLELFNQLPSYIQVNSTISEMLKDIDFRMIFNNSPHYISFWELTDYNRYIFWNTMKPLINGILNDLFVNNNLVKKVKYPVIHFRCSDVPFSRHPVYHFQKYSFFTDCLNEFKYQGIDTSKVYLMVYVNHMSSPKDVESSNKYIESLKEFLEQNHVVEIISTTSIDDFSILFYAPAVISTGSSYSFLSGFMGNGLFLTECHNGCNAPFIRSGYSIPHEHIFNYHDTNEVITKLKGEKYFTQHWTEPLREDIKKYVSGNGKMVCVEVGCFQGKGTNIIYDLLCNHPDSKLYCIDPWDNVYVKNNNKFGTIDDHFFVGQYAHFLHNTYGNDKIIKFQGSSNVMISVISEEVDFAFIDGDHSEEQVYNDANLIYKKMKDGGIIVFSAYKWNLNGQYPKTAIDRFVSENNVTILSSNDSLIVKVNCPSDLSVPLRFHVYAINWNESRLLPYFFKHYEQAEKIFILDNMSTDSSREIIKEYNRDIISFDTNGFFDDETNKDLKDNIWKKSDADYVIVCDLDEFLFFPNYPNDLLGAMTSLRDNNITIVKPTGYNMICNDELFESIPKDKFLSKYITDGVAHKDYDKCICFSPLKIKHMAYSAGSHFCTPTGEVNIKQIGLLLHYKYIGKTYLVERHLQLRDRLSKRNIYLGQGSQYLRDPHELLDSFYTDNEGKSIYKIMYPN